MLHRIRSSASPSVARLLIDDDNLIDNVDNFRAYVTIDDSDSASLLLPALHQLIKSLFCVRYVLQQSYSQCMIYRFIMFSSMIKDGQDGFSFRSPLKISSALSEIQFWARGAVVLELFRHDWIPSAPITTELYVFNVIPPFLLKKVPQGVSSDV